MALNISPPIAQLLRQRSSRIAVRSLATASPASTSTKPSFTSTLDNGPSLDDFVVGNIPERVVLGNTKACVPSATISTYPGLGTNLVFRSPRLPSYLKTSIPSGGSFAKIRKDLRGLGLHTVCEEARCPNIGDCWGGGAKEGASDAESKRLATATIMVRRTSVRVFYCAHKEPA